MEAKGFCVEYERGVHTHGDASATLKRLSCSFSHWHTHVVRAAPTENHREIDAKRKLTRAANAMTRPSPRGPRDYRHFTI